MRITVPSTQQLMVLNRMLPTAVASIPQQFQLDPEVSVALAPASATAYAHRPRPWRSRPGATELPPSHAPGSMPGSQTDPTDWWSSGPANGG